MTLSLMPDLDSKTATADLGYRARITVGGRDKAKFAPNINASFTRKIADEFYLNINDRRQVVDKEAPALSDNLAEIKAGGRTSRYYVRADGTLEYEIVLDAPPPEGYIELEIKCSPGLTFHHQPELTPEEIADGCVRPDNIINGYVIYCDQANGPYRTGQLGIIERSWVKDGYGAQEWTEQSIDVNNGNGRWRIKTPTNRAIYPVTIGPVLGYDTAPSSIWASFGANAIIATYATMPAVDGTSSVIHIYGGNQYHNLGIYDHDAVNNQPGALLGYAEATNGNGTVASVALVESLSASAKYWLAQQPKVNSNLQYNSVTAASRLSIPGAYQMPATWEPYAPSHVWARRMGIWVDYDEVAAGDTKKYLGIVGSSISKIAGIPKSAIARVINI